MTVTNTGSQAISLSNADHSGVPILNFVVNGKGSGLSSSDRTEFFDSVFYVGVSGCQFPWQGLGLAPGATGSGCVAFPVVSGTNVATVGFNLSILGLPRNDVALWET